MSFQQIFTEKGNLPHAFQVAAYDDLISWPYHLRGLLNTDTVRLAFQTDFVRYGTRLIRLFELGKVLGQGPTKRTMTVKLAAEVFDDLVVPLLDDDFDSFADMHVLIHLVSTLIDFALFFDATCRNNSLLLFKLSEKPKILEILVSDQSGSIVFKKLCEESFFYRSAPTVLKITQRLALLCASCTGGHGINTGLKRWYELVNVLQKLKEFQAITEAEFTWNSRQNKVHPGRVLRKLSLDHDERNIVRNRSATIIDPATLKLPDLIASKLFTLDIRLPSSKRGLDDLIDRITKSEIPSLLKVIINTFPCRICHDEALARSSGTSPDKFSTFEISGDLQEEQEVAEDITQQPLFGAQAGVWKVLLSAQALKDLKHLSHAGRFPQVEDKLRSLSSGAWKNGNLSKLAGSQKQRENMRTQLLIAKCGRDLRILWQIDVGYYEETASYRQLVKVWRVSVPDEVDKSIDRVVTVQRAQRFGLGSNVMRPQQDNFGIYIPREFPSQETFTAPAVPITSVSDQRAIELTNKFYALTKPVMASLSTRNISTEFPFETSREEVEIIKHYDTGTLILGRSGTGKTTCLVYQLLKKYIARRQIIDEEPIRQVLVTRSSVLSEKLKTYTKRLIESQLNKQIWFDAAQESTNEYIGASSEEDLDLRTFFDLPDEAFPLVCSFEQLLTMIGNTLADADRQHFHNQEPLSPTGTRLGKYIRRSQTVDFNLFKDEYWDQFNPHLTKGISPQLIFSEIMGVIKGSASKETEFCPLSRDQYLSRSCRLAPTFTTENGREGAYNLYEAYEKKKASLGDIDGIDRVLGIIRQLNADYVTRKKVESLLEEIYVDEIQDQRCLEILLLLNLVRNPRGIHFAGDTAQCISKDSTFRFQDIKALFFETFDPIARASNESHLSVPKLFTLIKNYRSHQGIISLASSVMKILYTIFPNTVDKLPPEQGQNDGPKPVFFVGFDEGLIADSMVGLNKANENVSDFGSEQVILVRDDSRKHFLQEALQNKAVVLTILESKGMEFEDVLLYGFFTDSPCQAGYRSLQKNFEKNVKDFDTVKHAEICSELKNLYVAITRPRARLWIVESSEESSQPVIKIFTQYDSEPLITICTPSDPDLVEKKTQLRSATTTDPIRFIERGNELLQRGLYKEALIRFKSGNDKRGQTIAQAFICREQGIKARGQRNEAVFVDSFEQALAHFMEAKLMPNVASCLEELNRFCESADVHVGMGASHYARAADLYIKGDNYAKASRVYNILGKYDLAASTLLRGELFDKFARYLAENRQRIDPKKVKDYSRLINMLFKQKKISPELQDLTTAALGTEEEKVKFFKAAGLTEQLAAHYENKNDFWSAWEVFLAEGSMGAALNVLARAKIAEDPISTTEKFRQTCIAFLPYGKARDFMRRSGIISSLSEDRVQYTHLHRLLSSRWENFIEFVESAKETKCYTTPWNLDDTFNILYVMSIHHLDPVSDVRSVKDLEIFIDAIRRIPRKLYGIKSVKELPEFFRVSMGFLPRQNTEELIILDYSPLSGKLPRVCDTAGAITSGVQLIAHRLLKLADQIHQRAVYFWPREWPQACLQYLVSSIIYFPRCLNCILANSFAESCNKTQDQCPHKHVQVTSSEYEHKTNSLIEITSLFSSLNSLHYQHGRSHDIGNRFIPAKRRWLERLLEALTFVSPFEHDPSYMKTIREKITKSLGYHNIHIALEEILLYRLEKEFNYIDSVSSLMEQLQLADWLGPKTRFQFGKAIGSKIHTRRFKSELIELRASVMNGLDSCVKAIGDNSMRPETLEANLEVCKKLLILHEHEYTHFFAVLNVFEFIAAYLICRLCRGNGYLLFPKSWITLHLPKFDTESKRGPLRLEDLDILGRCFLRLIDTFAEILVYLEDKLKFTPFGYRFGNERFGRNLPYMISYRNAHFLFICVLNILAMEIPPINFRSTFERIKDALRLSSLQTGQFIYDDITTIAIALDKSFTSPNLGIKGKDSLLLLTTTLKSGKSIPPILLVLQKYNGTPVLEMRSVVTTYTPGWSPSKTNQDSMDDAGATYSPEEEAAVSVIQQFWRHRYPLLLDHRKFLKTDEGKAAEVVNSIIITTFRKISSSEEDAKVDSVGEAETVRVAALAGSIKLILRTRGVTVYTMFRRLENQLKVCSDRANTLMEDATISIPSLERLQTIMFEELDQHQSQFNTAFKTIMPKQLINILNQFDKHSDDGMETVVTRLHNILDSAFLISKALKGTLGKLDKELANLAKNTGRRRVLR
ncbi:hypothetical protein EDC01DRAFT_726313 [Geopyxis carbonaria]|nr:hypothetical protein EDC01DRAFT_726313 [Geopyxis carbonaria]